MFSIFASVILDHVHYQNIKVCAFVAGGGLDILGMYCTKKYPELSVGKISGVINAGIYLIVAFQSFI